ncbi:hypothetical protein JTE90_004564 [Oedothorax gibbosus]|uniref:CAP-Gly domain-containing protein n=1 Tax=Oedothorax gibbosus TaxID=931172 RepID=A0AAV6UJG8_9ARAC|nr:hypothetical protein JTE90_004564 [Oedothorax gibbosus]
MSNFCDEDRVLVLGKTCPGTLAFIGNTHFSNGMWFGVILDEPIGRNNGSYGGVQYFKCPKNHGVFVRPCQVTKIVDYKKQLLKHNSSKNYPNYLSEASIWEKPSKALKTDDIVRILTKKKSELSTIICGREQSCSVVENKDIPETVYEIVQYRKCQKNPFGHCAKLCQVTVPDNKPATQTAPDRFQNTDRQYRHSSSKIPIIKTAPSTLIRDASPDNEVQDNVLSTIDSLDSSAIEIIDITRKDETIIETLSNEMKNNRTKLENDFHSNKEKELTRNCSKQSVEMEFLSPEINRFFSKTNEDVTEIKEYVLDLNEKLKRLKTQ